MTLLPTLLVYQAVALCWSFLRYCQLFFDNDAKEEDTCRHTKGEGKHCNQEESNRFAIDCCEDYQSKAKNYKIGGKGKEIAKIVHAISALSIGGEGRNEAHVTDLHESPSYTEDDAKAHVIDEFTLICGFHYHKQRHKGNRHQ